MLRVVLEDLTRKSCTSHRNHSAQLTLDPIHKRRMTENAISPFSSLAIGFRVESCDLSKPQESTFFRSPEEGGKVYTLSFFHLCLSLLLLLRHRVIVATAESGGLRPPGLASGRPPGSARGRPQGQVTTPRIALFASPPSLHHDPCGDAGQLCRRNHYAKRNL